MSWFSRTTALPSPHTQRTAHLSPGDQPRPPPRGVVVVGAWGRHPTGLRLMSLTNLQTKSPRLCLLKGPCLPCLHPPIVRFSSGHHSCASQPWHGWWSYSRMGGDLKQVNEPQFLGFFSWERKTLFSGFAAGKTLSSKLPPKKAIARGVGRVQLGLDSSLIRANTYTCPAECVFCHLQPQDSR